MTKHKLSAADGEGFLRAFTDEIAELQLGHQVSLVLWVSPTSRKGVLKLELSAVQADDSPGSSVVAKYTTEYPTAAVGSLEACMFQCAVKVGRLLRDQALYPMGRA
jgi:hypothetical protein